MLRKQTQRKLAEFFVLISDFETQLEISRQKLAQLPEFEPYAAFKRINRKKKQQIDADDIDQFLQQNGIFHDLEHLQYYINWHDDEKIGYLNYMRFLNAIIPQDSPHLRAQVAQRPTYEVYEDEYLPYEIEYALSRVIDLDIQLNKETEYLKIALNGNEDFGILEAFTFLNLKNSDFLQIKDFQYYLEKLGINLNQEQLTSLYRRMDRDQDGKVSLKDFRDSIYPLEKALQEYFALNKQNKQPYNQRNEFNKRGKDDGRISKKLNLTSNNFRKNSVSPGENLERKNQINLPNYNQFLEKSQLLAQQINPNHISYIENIKKDAQIYCQESQNQVDNCFQNQINNNYKENDNSQFNQSGYMNKKKKYRNLSPVKGASVSKQVREKKMKEESQCSKLKKNREQYQQYKRHINKYIVGKEFEDQRKILKIFRDSVNYEKELEFLKQDLILKKDFNFRDAFKFFDFQENGGISQNQFEEKISNLGIIVGKEEVFLFFRKFDLNSDGKITFQDFLEALLPVQKDFYALAKDKIINRQLDPVDDLKQIKKLYEIHCVPAFEKEINMLYKLLNKDKEDNISFVDFVQFLQPKTKQINFEMSHFYDQSYNQSQFM
ncbi:hypothetical protein PPERSA_05469 [Pseudocohnilembus persalinus]|uniref:EF-hand domain-containing protein n=1 Tax=Pseudocohnilembus persalinus TaxID=266149 RepID=A0A0V0R829_PSEPJ|nr:hypothetical protein PPERSA_05469 [Pseudocohnilembus persalinus]|eukprot:KRX10649.1 hypothetical protein PPERSA_05469 [Pseudocohnilembus persalinus]